MTEMLRSGLGQFLRSRRERLTPDAVGLPARRRRRTPGLRREEVAELANIGVDWYVRLEQGRHVNPSATTIDSLARALRLDEAETRHLGALARDGARRPFQPEQVPASIEHLVRSLDQPAYVTGRRWDVLAWNEAAVELFTDFGALAEGDRNILVYILLDPHARQLFGPDWAELARRVVAKFRLAHDFWACDPMFVALSTRLRNDCPEFEGWWGEHDVLGDGAGRKVLQHPLRGTIGYDYATFQATDDSALKLTIYTPVPS